MSEHLEQHYQEQATLSIALVNTMSCAACAVKRAIFYIFRVFYFPSEVRMLFLCYKNSHNSSLHDHFLHSQFFIP